MLFIEEMLIRELSPRVSYLEEAQRYFPRGDLWLFLSWLKNREVPPASFQEAKAQFENLWKGGRANEYS